MIGFARAAGVNKEDLKNLLQWRLIYHIRGGAVTNDKKIEMEYVFDLEDRGYVFSLMFFHKKYLAGMLGNLPRGIFFLHFWCVFQVSNRIGFSSQKMWFSVFSNLLPAFQVWQNIEKLFLKYQI